MKYGLSLRIMKTSPSRMPFPDALRVKRAELWLKLGLPTEALKELKTVSLPARRHPWASQVVVDTLQTYCAVGSAGRW